MKNLALAVLLLLPASAHATCANGNTTWANFPFAKQTAPFTVGFSAASFASKIDGVLGFSLGAASGYSSLAASIRFNNAGYLDARNGGAYGAVTNIPYGPSSWFGFRVVIDPSARTYSVYVTPTGGTEKTLALNYAFRTDAPATAIDNWALYDSAGSHQVCGVVVAGVALTVTASTAPAPTPAPVTVSSSGTDRFGVKKIYPTASNGKDWTAKWDNGAARTFKFADDPYDNWFHGKGDATYNPDGKGNFNISGSVPRMYIIDPAQSGWRNVEMTVYAKRVADSGTSWGGIEGVARTNHTADTTNKCDTRGNDARFRYDGHIDFEKETNHPASVATLNKAKWSTLPYNTWIGYKLVVYDLPNGNVKLESWMDLADGVNGGTWVKVNEIEDNGSNFGVGGTPCKSGIDPALRLTNNDARPGTETGKPNLAVYWRSDNVGTNGLIYKKMSVREIAP